MKKFLFSLIAFAIIAPAAVAESGANQSFVSSPLGQNCVPRPTESSQF